MSLSINTKITKKRIQNHFAYARWQYIVAVIAMVLGWELVYSVTAYRPPDDKVISAYICTPSMASDSDNLLRELTMPLFPEVEDITFQHISIGSSDDYYAQMQLSTYIGAREGDLFLMTSDQFRIFAEQGLFMPLDEYISSGIIDVTNIDTSALTFTLDGEYTTSGESVSGIYGVSAAGLYGLMDLGIDNRRLDFGITAYSGNPDDIARMINWFITEYTQPKPDWLIETDNITAPDEVLPSY